MRRFTLLAVIAAAFVFVPAAQAFAHEPLTVRIEGTGTGNVIPGSEFNNYKGTPPVNCEKTSAGTPVECTVEMSDEGEGYEQVIMKAVPNAGSKFVSWTVEHASEEFCNIEVLPSFPNGEGCAPYVEPPGSGTGNAKAIVVINAIPYFALNLSTTGTGSGSFECKVLPSGTAGPCAAEYEEGKEVEVIPVPGGGSAFAEWTGACTGTGSCVVTMSAAKSVTGVFNAGTTEFKFTVTRNGTGTGSLSGGSTARPSTISCAAGTGACAEHEYVEGEVVKLKATAAAGSIFAAWTNCTPVSGHPEECEVTMSAAKSVTATFNVPPPSVISVSPAEGSTAGGQIVTIVGANLTGTIKAEFGTREVKAIDFLSDSATEISLEAPESSAGRVHVTVTTSSGTSATSAADEYTYVASPAVTAVSPASGPTEGGDVVVISGRSLAGASRVAFGGSAATIVENTGTTIKTTAPAHAAGSVHVTVTTIGGTSGNFAADEYTYVPPQALSIAKAGSGSGSVSCDGGVCASSYPFGATVTLSASAASGSKFTAFSGACAGTGSCAVKIEGPTSVTATFEKEEVKPPPPSEGTAEAASSATVSGGSASLRISCSGGHCKGSFKLTAKVKQGKKTKTVVIGKTSYNVAAGKSKTVKVKITNSQIKKDLNNGKTVKAQLSGSGIKTSTVTLKPDGRTS
ncbi:MAG TPA: IPT/TIG domain-containing protein [Solirubrobacterales bacterium]|nr:IPT/TIG domain-containing protein [Solirubrobacterales bacterium]